MLPETAVESSVYMLNNTSEESAQPRLDDRPPVGSFDIGSLEDMTWVFQPETVGLAGGYGCSGEKPQHQAASQDSHAKKAPAVKVEEWETNFTLSPPPALSWTLSWSNC